MVNVKLAGAAEDYVELLNGSIINIFKNSCRIFFNNPGQSVFLGKTLLKQRKAVATRQRWKEKGTHVPPFMILSITGRCNLRCKGCYASVHQQKIENEMSETKLRGILEEARELGISIVLIAGGEPFTRSEIISILKDFPEIIFPVFTNGLLLKEQLIERIKNAKNIIPIISLEGRKVETDARRGSGVFSQLENILDNLGKAGVMSGISFTLTRENFNIVLDEDYIRELINSNSQVFFFVEYVPVNAGTEFLTVTGEQRRIMMERINGYRSELPALFIAFPGDEEKFGGCLAAGRGFIHINPQGNIEPCPFAPYSDTNLENLTLQEGLKSDLLLKIRSNQDILAEAEGAGGCTLWSKRELVKSLLECNEKENQEINFMLRKEINKNFCVKGC